MQNRSEEVYVQQISRISFPKRKKYAIARTNALRKVFFEYFDVCQQSRCMDWVRFGTELEFNEIKDLPFVCMRIFPKDGHPCPFTEMMTIGKCPMRKKIVFHKIMAMTQGKFPIGMFKCDK